MQVTGKTMQVYAPGTRNWMVAAHCACSALTHMPAKLLWHFSVLGGTAVDGFFKTVT